MEQVWFDTQVMHWMKKTRAVLSVFGETIDLPNGVPATLRDVLEGLGGAESLAGKTFRSLLSDEEWSELDLVSGAIEAAAEDVVQKARLERQYRLLLEFPSVSGSTTATGSLVEKWTHATRLLLDQLTLHLTLAEKTALPIEIDEEETIGTRPEVTSKKKSTKKSKRGRRGEGTVIEQRKSQRQQKRREEKEQAQDEEEDEEASSSKGNGQIEVEEEEEEEEALGSVEEEEDGVDEEARMAHQQLLLAEADVAKVMCMLKDYTSEKQSSILLSVPNLPDANLGTASAGEALLADAVKSGNYLSSAASVNVSTLEQWGIAAQMVAHCGTIVCHCWHLCPLALNAGQEEEESDSGSIRTSHYPVESTWFVLFLFARQQV